MDLKKARKIRKRRRKRIATMRVAKSRQRQQKW
jgi:hypothetical protein